MRLLPTVLALCTVFPMVANAQTPTEAAPAPVAEPVAAPPVIPAPAPVAEVVAPAPEPAAPAPEAPIAFAWEGLVDTYYMYNFTGDPKMQGPALRNFDLAANSFSLNYAKLGVHADTDMVSFRMDIGAGHTASIINGSSQSLSTGATAASPGDGIYTNGFLVQQAYATVRPHANISIDAGKFVTSAGAEVIESNKNWLYSRSFLFYGIPLLHTGLRINAALLGTIAAPELVASFQLVNGWNNDPDINSDKTFGLNLVYTPPGQGLTAAFTSYIGKEASGAKTSILADLVVTKDIGNVSVGLNVDYFKLDAANWFGVAGMGRFIVSDAFTLAARAEYLKCKNAFIAGEGSLYEFTGMGAWTVSKHYELRAEVRADMSDKELFMKGATPKKNQVTGTLAALAYF